MEAFRGDALSWELKDGVVELALHRAPCNEIGSLTLDELEQFVTVLDGLESEAHALIIYSEVKAGFCAGADLRELHRRSQEMERKDAAKGVRNYLERMHRVLNTVDCGGAWSHVRRWL
jgi:enoyl-CoA hydratase/carnithine racemase